MGGGGRGVRRTVGFFFFWFWVANFRILASFFLLKTVQKNCYLEGGFLKSPFIRENLILFCHIYTRMPDIKNKFGKWAVF